MEETSERRPVPVSEGSPAVNVHLYAWVITIVVTVAILAFDIFIIGRRPHEPSMKEAGIATGVYVGLAVLFGVGVGFIAGTTWAGQFFAGWLTEYSLSIDNLFIFLLIMAKLAVPRKLQQFALLVGIVLALVLRGIFIALGAALIAQFAWVFFLFGGFLLYTAIKLVIDYRKDEDEEAPDNVLLRLVRRRLPATEEFHGTRLTIKQDDQAGGDAAGNRGGRRLITPMFIVVVALGSTDLLFALDSIPAIYGLTAEPYLVLTANIFALMGLRQLYFLLGGLLTRLVYLSIGLAVILGFIGVKLVLEALHSYHVIEIEVPIWLSLLVIVATLLVTTWASLVKARRDERASTATS